MKKQINLAKTPKKQKGEGLVSLAVALIVIAIIVGGLYSVFRDMNQKEATSTAVQQINQIGGSLRKNFGVHNQYGGITTAVAVQSRTVPDSLRITGTNTAQNSFGGLITFAPASLTNADDAAAMTWGNIPPANCAEIVIGSQNTARRITVGTTVVKAIDAPLVVATLTTACDVAAPLPITWDIGRTGA